jgi:hypothetical protein
MRCVTGILLVLGCFTVLSTPGLAGAPAPAPASAAEYVAVERFLTDLEKPPVAYQARRRMEASSSRLNESAWMEAITSYSSAAGFSYQIVAQGGSERIGNRVLKKVLEAEKENSEPREWLRGVLSRDNYEFNVSGRTAEGHIQVQLNPRRRDSRLVDGVAVLAPQSGDLLKVEGRLSKSPSMWVRWADVCRRYTVIGGAAMPVSIESTADVRLAGVSKFTMSYAYNMVDGQAIASPRILASR